MYGVAFSPNGKLLASADGYSDMVRLWNPATGQPVGAPLRTGSQNAAVSVPNAAMSVTFSPDGKLVIGPRRPGQGALWDLTSGQAISPPLRRVAGVGFRQNGKLLVTVDNHGRARLGTRLPVSPSARSRTPARRTTCPRWPSAVTARCWPPGNDSGTVWLRTLGNGHPVGKPLPSPSAENSAWALRFSPNDRLLATAYGDGTVRLWDLATGRPVGAPLQGGTTGAGGDGAAYSPNGKLLVGTDANGTLRLWNPATGQAVTAPLPDPGAQDAGLWATFSPSGKLLATAGANGTLRLWNPATGQPVSTPGQLGRQNGVIGAAFSRNSKLLATADDYGTVRQWDAATGQPVGRPLNADAATNGSGSTVAFSPSGKLLASAGGDGRMRLWDSVTGRRIGGLLQADAGNGATVNGVAFSPNGKLLATAGNHGTVRLWNPATGHLVGRPLAADTGLNRGVNAVHVQSPRQAAGQRRRRRLGTAAGIPPRASLSRAPIPTGAGVVQVAFSPSGRQLATEGSDSTVQLWNLSLFIHPYAALCDDVGPPMRQDWAKYAPGESQPKICA